MCKLYLIPHAGSELLNDKLIKSIKNDIIVGAKNSNNKQIKRLEKLPLAFFIPVSSLANVAFT